MSYITWIRLRCGYTRWKRWIINTSKRNWIRMFVCLLLAILRLTTRWENISIYSFFAGSIIGSVCHRSSLTIVVRFQCVWEKNGKYVRNVKLDCLLNIDGMWKCVYWLWVEITWQIFFSKSVFQSFHYLNTKIDIYRRASSERYIKWT